MFFKNIRLIWNHLKIQVVFMKPPLISMKTAKIVGLENCNLYS